MSTENHLKPLLAAAVLVAALCRCGVAASVTVSVDEAATSAERIAARELADHLARLFPADTFTFGGEGKGAGSRSVWVGSNASLGDRLREFGITPPAEPEGFRVAVAPRRPDTAVIVGGSPRGAAYGVYRLLERLGLGFYLSFQTAPAPHDKPFSFDGWSLTDHPLVRTRLVFNWHNFLSGCTGWDLPQWKQWIAGAQRIGFNTVMVHAYGNNPMFTFSFNGKTKPVGWVATSRRGRDWGNEHVNDVGRIPGGEIFASPEFGAAAALVPDAERVTAVQTLMQQVFAYAEELDMDVCFALDVDTGSVLPRDMIMTLPEKARFQNGGGWLPRPDVEEGYAFYKAQVNALLDLYPQIDFLALWRRSNAQEWGKLKKCSQLPKDWQGEYQAHISGNPGVAELPQAVCSFALNKVVGAFRRALDERGRKDVRIGMGSWEVEWIPALAEFLPQDITLMPLDSSCLRTRRGSFFRNADAYRGLSTGQGRLLPIIWAQHDDGDYIGRPIHPHADFQDALQKLGVRGYGIIHWMTRPLDPYFKNHENQVWSATRNEPYRETCRAMAERCFGRAHAETLGKYLGDWWTDAPIFGRVTSDHFFRANEHITDPKRAAAKCRERLAVLERVDTSAMTPAQRERLAYYRALENVIVSFCEVQEFVYDPAVDALKAGEFPEARRLLRSADPADTMRQFSRLSRMAGGNRGEEAMVVSLGTRWIPDYIAARQAASVDAVRIRYAPTTFEPLAQGAGAYTFRIDDAGDYWSVRGERETRHRVSGRGVLVDSHATLDVSPIVRTQSRLAPGDYELAFRVAGTGRVSVVDVSVGCGAASTSGYRIDPVRGGYMRLVCRGNDANAWNSIHEITCPAIRRDSVTASAAVKGYEARNAVDGRESTRWAAEGRGQWIQFALDPGVSVEGIEIAWYEGGKRRYDFDIMVSRDETEWRKIAVRPAKPGFTSGRRLDIGTEEKVFTLPVHLDTAGSVQLELKPLRGAVTVREVVLRPVRFAEESGLPSAGSK